MQLLVLHALQPGGSELQEQHRLDRPGRLTCQHE
jgi:hypothetical protein